MISVESLTVGNEQGSQEKADMRIVEAAARKVGLFHTVVCTCECGRVHACR